MEATEICDECKIYIKRNRFTNTYSSNTKMALFNSYLGIINQSYVNCKVCNNSLYLYITHKHTGYNIEFCLDYHSSIDQDLLKKTYIHGLYFSEKAYYLVKCPEMGNLIFTSYHKTWCAIYFDVPIKLDTDCPISNFHLEDDRAIYMGKNSDGFPVFIDTTANIVPYHMVDLKRVDDTGIYENDKFSISINCANHEVVFTNKIAGSKTKAALRSPDNNSEDYAADLAY